MVTGGHVKCSFSLILVSEPDKVIGIYEVKLGEYVNPLQQFRATIHEKERIMVLYGDLIESKIISARPQGFTNLPYEEESSTCQKSRNIMPEARNSETYRSMASLSGERWSRDVAR